MIEKRFNDPTGFSDKNTFFQFDQWESSRIRSAKNRYIFDFSFPIVYGKPDRYLLDYTLGQEQIETGQSRIFKNLQPSNTYLGYGVAGGMAEFIGSFDAERTVNADEATISVNKNTFMHLNKRDSGTLEGVQLAESVNFFRSGYIEFTIKTTNQNCIVASGSSQVDAQDYNTIIGTFGSTMEQGASLSALHSGDTMSPYPVATENHPYYRADNFEGALVNLNIRIVNGRLAIEYYDEFNKEDVNFLFIGNDIIADGQWHHIVVNFGRPGLIKTNGVKFNQKFVEIWKDGVLDKRFDDKVNEYQIFYPTVKWLFNNVKDIVYNVLNNDLDVETNADIRGHVNDAATVGFNELQDDIDLFTTAVESDFFAKNAYSGAIHTFAHGINIPISQYEIKRRFRLWQKQTKKFAKIIDISATMVEPVVTTNSKKIIKLFWSNIYEDGKHGVELDKSYQVESFSVTHNLKNSRTQLFNHDVIKNKKTVNILENVRIVLTDNVLVNGPGNVLIYNTEEPYYTNLGYGLSVSALQVHPKGRTLDSVSNDLSNFDRVVGQREDLYFSGVKLNSGDRILLTNQIRPEENGIWIYNDINSHLTRANDSLITDDQITAVYVSDGENAGTYWSINKSISSLADPQKWSLIDTSNIDNMQIAPILGTRWKDYRGNERFINVLEDINLNNYDAIVFMNYPTSNKEVFDHFPNNSEAEIVMLYNNFINSLKIAASNGANIFVSSPKLAEDMGIVKRYDQISQEIEAFDGRSAEVNPFQTNESNTKYFDTHRQNKYHVATLVPGLTDKETWVMTDAISYIPDNVYDYEQLHLKYSYRQTGLQLGNEFIIPSLPLTKNATNKNLPGYRSNARTENLYVVAPQNILAGTVVTKLANTHYHDATLANNEYDDYATTIIVHNGQLLGNYPINGKIFVNCVEDSYTMSREEYNKGIIQTVSQTDPGEDLNTIQWNYSTNRVDRKPQRINVTALTAFGQTTPTLGNGGPIVQAATASANGIIRHATDAGNTDYQSDLYTSVSDEIYPIQEIPVLSMTWLGLQWLAE